ncbi:hypothetical protein [Acidovorax sp. SRB_24]|uniref:hypothetical protein n=1 Tax=Acidovorax sp. SRB_24 TaxID=1962700 RepID=UPI00145DAE91|nr:hypothetical protein [Acidovorax sp. SRB_24]NMM76220.1 hypothetical protein [Acidovorax sp. SRB_24]
MPNPIGVIRTVTIPVPLFTHLKNCQRHIQQTEGRKLTNSHTLAVILRQHRDIVGPALQRTAQVSP